MLRNCALELLFADSQSIFLVFKDEVKRKLFLKELKTQKHHMPLFSWEPIPKSLKLIPKNIFKASQYHEMWQQRKISNFEYLMRLNMLAGKAGTTLPHLKFNFLIKI